MMNYKVYVNTNDFPVTDAVIWRDTCNKANTASRKFSDLLVMLHA